MFRASFFKKAFLGTVILSLVAGLFLAAAPTGSVSAAAVTQTPAPTQVPDNSQGAAQGGAQAQTQTDAQADANANGVARLEKLYQAELKVLDRQGKWVDRTEKIIAWVNKIIDRFLGQGKVVDLLRAALDRFQAGVDQAKARHDSAAAILALHRGFDENGKVTNRVLALETVKTAGQDLRQAAKIYRQTVVSLRQSVRQFIKNNRP